jgi:hypothetical protein
MSAGSSSSISSTSSSSSDLATRRDGGTERQRPPENEVERFQRLMERREDRDSNAPMEDWEAKRLLAQMDGSALMGQQSSAPAVAAAAAPAATVAAPLDELVAKYVQMLAVSDPSAAGDPRLMMKLDPNLLPQTELFLVKAPEGWVLQANTRSPEAYRTLTEFGPALERRFAARRLGALRLETNLQPSALAPAK